MQNARRIAIACLTFTCVTFTLTNVSLGAGSGHTSSSLSLQPAHKVTSPLADTALAKMVGEWRGTSWIMTPVGERHEGQAVERIHWNLAGTALIVEGYGYTTEAASGEITVSHDAMGIIEHDARTGGISFLARRNGAEFTRNTLTIDEGTGKIQWTPGGPQANAVRFTLELTEERWLEIGEWSRDGGTTWVQFMGTDLTPVKE